MCSRPPGRRADGPDGPGGPGGRCSADPPAVPPPLAAAAGSTSGSSERSVRTINNAPSTSLAVASGRSPRSTARNRQSGQAVQDAPGSEPHSGHRPSGPRLGSDRVGAVRGAVGGSEGVAGGGSEGGAGGGPEGGAGGGPEGGAGGGSEGGAGGGPDGDSPAQPVSGSAAGRNEVSRSATTSSSNAASTASGPMDGGPDRFCSGSVGPAPSVDPAPDCVTRCPPSVRSPRTTPIRAGSAATGPGLRRTRSATCRGRTGLH